MPALLDMKTQEKLLKSDERGDCKAHFPESWRHVQPGIVDHCQSEII